MFKPFMQFSIFRWGNWDLLQRFLQVEADNKTQCQAKGKWGRGLLAWLGTFSLRTSRVHPPAEHIYFSLWPYLCLHAIPQGKTCPKLGARIIFWIRYKLSFLHNRCCVDRWVCTAWGSYFWHAHALAEKVYLQTRRMPRNVERNQEGKEKQKHSPWSLMRHKLPFPLWVLTHSPLSPKHSSF